MPTNIAVDDAGFVYVTDPYNDRVEVFTSQGLFVSEWGGSGRGPGQFSEPYGIAIHRNYLYVGDAGNSRVQQFGSLPTTVRRATWGALKGAYR